MTARQSDVVTDTSEELTPRQTEFVRTYLECGNATQAATQAGYSAKTAATQGWQLLQNPKIRGALRGRQRRRAALADLRASDVLKQAQRMAFADPRWFIDENGDPIPVQDLSDDAAAALQGLEVEYGPSGPRLKYKLVDKGAAVDRVMRHLGMFGEDNRQLTDPVAQMLAAIHGTGSRIPLKP